MAERPSIAAAKPPVEVALSGVYVEHDADGIERDVAVESRAAVPGSVIRYEITTANTGASTVYHVVPQGRIPAGTAYRTGSASIAASAHVEFSLDGGKTWSATPTTTIRTAQGTKVVPAPAASYTAVRWVGTAPLRAGAAAHYSYAVTVK
ncbi:MAG TPA: hypothetical protein VMA36_03810 [Candidatus Limnocylindria bacterium]|nr:hypothetical protein [Candidatus Limnocylindria bacterium]